MTIYSFRCNECEKVFDVAYQHMSGPASHKCECGADAKRYFYVPAAKYVGRGFSTNDAEVEREGKKINEIAENAYTKRAEIAASRNPVDDTWYQEAAKIVGG